MEPSSQVRSLAEQDEHFTGIQQSRNRGHQNAVLAGLMEAKDRCDITISIDCDGQDDIDAMDQMVDAYLDGCEVVYGVRADRRSDSFFQRFTAPEGLVFPSNLVEIPHFGTNFYGFLIKIKNCGPVFHPPRCVPR